MHNQTLRDVSPLRFTSISIGIGIPLFAKNQKVQIAAARVDQNRMQNEYARAEQRLNTSYQQALTQVMHYTAVVLNF